MGSRDRDVFGRLRSMRTAKLRPAVRFVGTDIASAHPMTPVYSWIDAASRGGPGTWSRPASKPTGTAEGWFRHRLMPKVLGAAYQFLGGRISKSQKNLARNPRFINECLWIVCMQSDPQARKNPRNPAKRRRRPIANFIAPGVIRAYGRAGVSASRVLQAPGSRGIFGSTGGQSG